jgi:hypothetical protein
MVFLLSARLSIPAITVELPGMFQQMEKLFSELFSELIQAYQTNVLT